MRRTVPRSLAPLAAAAVTSFRPTLRLVASSGLPAASELAAFLAALTAVPADAPTACAAWSAHELVAHMAAGSAEMARLVRARLELGPGADIGPTRPFDEREAPYVAMPDRVLRRQFVIEGLALTDALLVLETMGPDVTVPFTGWDMTAAEMVMHGRSELSLHRWDLIGSDQTSMQLLAQPELFAHGTKVLAHMALTPPSQTGQGTAPSAGPVALLELWGRDPDRPFDRQRL